MKGLFLVLLTVTFFSCQSHSDNNFAQKEIDTLISDTVKYDSSYDKLIEQFFPSQITSEQSDTTIGNINVSIIKKTINTYVTYDYTEERIRHLDKYRDFEIRLVIKQNLVKLIDTSFRKESFLNPTDSFLKIAILYNYWFREIKNNEIELFGTIDKPETDWAYSFRHYFNLTTKKFRIVEETEEENE